MIDAATSNPGKTPKPVGTGPFMYADWQPNSHFTAIRNPNYWRKGLPYLDQITFKPIPDTSQREATLRSGGVDMIESVNPTTITNFSGSGGSRLPTGRHPHRGHRPAVVLIHHVEHGGGADQRPDHPPGAGQGHRPEGGADHHRRAPGPAGHGHLPPRLAVLQQHRLSHLRSVRGQGAGGGLQGQARDADPQSADHPRPAGDQGGPGRPADVAAGRVRRDRVRGGAGRDHRRLRRWASSRR